MDIFDQVMELRASADQPHFAVFDFDGTVIHHDCTEAVLAYMTRHDIPETRGSFDRYYSLLDSGDFEAAYHFGAGILRGMSADEVDALVRMTMQEEGTEISDTELAGRRIARGIALRKNVADLLRCLQAAGIATWIVSASPELVVRATMRYFGIDAPVIGLRNVAKDGVMTEELQEPLSIAKGKVNCIKAYIAPAARPLLGVGDSMNDCPMLEYSQLRAVVDRGNSLAEKARAESWILLQ